MGIRPAAATLVLLAATAAAGEPREYRGALHVHSLLSHDSRGTFEAIAAAAGSAGLDFVILTDHPGRGAPERQPDGPVAGVLFIPGIETHHLLALGVTRALTATTTAGLIAEIHRQGGVAIAAHPDSFTEWNAPGLDGAEVYDVFDDVRDEWLVPAAVRWLLALRRDPATAFTAFFDYPAAAIRRWGARLAVGPFAGLGGTDAHENVRIGPWLLDPYGRQLGIVQLRVRAAELSRQAVLGAIRRGQVETFFPALGEPGPVRFSATDGRRVATVGGTLRTHAALDITIGAPPAARIRLIRDGHLLWTGPAGPGLVRVAVPPPSSGVYRLELWTRRTGRELPWLLTNAIRSVPGR